MPNSNDSPDIAGMGAGLLEFSAELVQQFGGIKGLVTKFRDVWEDDRTTAAVKNQIAIFVAKIMTEAQEMRGSVDYAKMTNEELESAALKLMAKHNGVLPWKKESGNEVGTRDNQSPEVQVLR